MTRAKRRRKPFRAQLRPVASLALGPGRQARWREALAKLVLLIATMLVLAILVQWGGPPFGYRLGQRVDQDITVRAEFTWYDDYRISQERRDAEIAIAPVFENRTEPIRQLGDELKVLLDEVVLVDSPNDLSLEMRNAWDLSDGLFYRLRDDLPPPEQLGRVIASLDLAIEKLARRGVLGRQTLPRSLAGSERLEILEAPAQDLPQRSVVVRATMVEPEEIAKTDGIVAGDFVSQFDIASLGRSLYQLLGPRLAQLQTLDYRRDLTRIRRNQARDQVPVPAEQIYRAGQLLVPQGERIGRQVLPLLRAEHEAFRAQQPLSARILRALAILTMTATVIGLAAVYVLVKLPGLAAHTFRVGQICALGVLAMMAVRLLATQPWQAELLPLAAAAMILALATTTTFALVGTLVLSTLTCLALGTGVGHLIILLGSISTGVLTLDQVRSRTKLIQVGSLIGLGGLVLSLAVGSYQQEPMDLVLGDALWRGCWGVLAGFFLGGILPYLENRIGLVTGISLLELGDMSHPLLQELVQRAPGTHNHSMTVAVLAEAAAERIGADALLVRVGAYFHDIGKMLKPHYFIENQIGSDNRHANLAPAMSTLIIIGHVKDGVDLARQHHLPEPIIDLIEQHHGTTLVEFFYREATRRHNGTDASPVAESAFRYPGPRPRTKEAAILMMADMVESASRTLSDPTPARIESLVRTLVDKRLHDDQFDECDLTLQQIAAVRESLIKSLISVYHGRVTYPEQRTA